MFLNWEYSLPPLHYLLEIVGKIGAADCHRQSSLLKCRLAGAEVRNGVPLERQPQTSIILGTCQRQILGPPDYPQCILIDLSHTAASSQVVVWQVPLQWFYHEWTYGLRGQGDGGFLLSGFWLNRWNSFIVLLMVCLLLWPICKCYSGYIFICHVT